MARKLKISQPIAIKELEIATKNRVTTSLIGKYKSTFKGRGLEFDGYRAYTPDDDASMIDFKASARSDTLLVKQFVEERNLNLFILMDISQSMLTTSTKKIKIEYAAEVAATIGQTVIESGDNLGYSLFSEDSISGFDLQNNIDVINFFLNDLSNPSNFGGAFNFNKALEYIIENIPEYSLVIIISDFIYIGDEWLDNFRICSAKYDLIGIMVRDPLDLTLPQSSSQIVVSDPYTGEKMLIEPKRFKKRYEEEIKKELDYFKETFKENSSDLLILRTDENFLIKLINFFNERALRWK
ncbi:DUF58 domain-containing protein [Candidatus Woesearchaeota archaeon]|nr:MAG: DUF58 domain-containing protein [Candidatus Woesearchaeota archaeon]